MTRKTVVIAVSLLLGLAAGVAGTLVALFYTPAFYATALQIGADPVVRKEQAKRFVQTTLQLVDGIRNSERWSEEFTEEQVNSWLAEELHQKYTDWLPRGVREPRVKFDEDALDLAFQFQKAQWAGVVSAHIRPWVAGPDQLAIEIRSIRAGLVPIPLEDVLAEVSEELQNVGWRIQWKQTGGNDVLVVHLHRGEGEQPQLDAIQLRPQSLRISGSRRSPVAVLPQSTTAIK